MSRSPDNSVDYLHVISESKQLIFLIVFAVIIVSGYMGYQIFNELKYSQESAFKQRAEGVVHSLTHLGGRYITNFDWPLLEELVQQVKKNPIVISAQIEDSLSDQVFGEMDNEAQENVKHYTVEIQQNGRNIGRASVIIDESSLNHTLRWLRNTLWLSVVAILVVILGLVYMLIKSKASADKIKREIDERRKAEENLRKLSLAVEQSPASVVITDKRGVIEYINPKFLKITGYSTEEIIGRDSSILNSGLTPKETYRALWDKLTKGKEWRGEFHNKKKNGETFWEYASVSPIRATDGSVTHYLAVKEDITLRKNYESELEHQANYDSLTGLANRVLARDRLDQAIKRARREGSLVGLLFIDLDHFKKVNDTLGHAAGDDILVETALRLRSCMREQDTVSRHDDYSELGTIARLGGDEFTVILHGLRNPLDAEIVADRILKACAIPFLAKGQELFLSASIGITICPDDTEDSEDLMRNADAAMYHAKEEGRGTSRFFKKEINDIAQERLRMENELRHGFAHGEFELFFQPLFDSLNNTLEGAEALLRWRSPSRGLVSPDEFIPLVEDTGLIIPIGEWVLRTACEQVAAWQSYSGKPLYVSVNLSTRQFQNNLVEIVSKTLKETSLSPEYLKLEITETVLLQETENTKAIIQAIHDMGVQFSIDDFGTGYSSLSYLRSYPFNYLKIDRSFIQNVTTNKSDASLVESIIAMALNLDLKVVAEGIETDEQYAFVKKAGCDIAQGYGLGRPMQATDFIALLTTDNEGMKKALG